MADEDAVSYLVYDICTRRRIYLFLNMTIEQKYTVENYGK